MRHPVIYQREEFIKLFSGNDQFKEILNREIYVEPVDSIFCLDINLDALKELLSKNRYQINPFFVGNRKEDLVAVLVDKNVKRRGLYLYQYHLKAWVINKKIFLTIHREIRPKCILVFPIKTIMAHFLKGQGNYEGGSTFFKHNLQKFLV